MKRFWYKLLIHWHSSKLAWNSINKNKISIERERMSSILTNQLYLLFKDLIVLFVLVILNYFILNSLCWTINQCIVSSVIIPDLVWGQGRTHHHVWSSVPAMAYTQLFFSTDGGLQHTYLDTWKHGCILNSWRK